MSLAPPNWNALPRKHCFVACPEGVHCECRERLAYELGRPLLIGVDIGAGDDKTGYWKPHAGNPDSHDR